MKPWEGRDGTDGGHHGRAVGMLRQEEKGTGLGPMHLGTWLKVWGVGYNTAQPRVAALLGGRMGACGACGESQPRLPPSSGSLPGLPTSKGFPRKSFSPLQSINQSKLYAPSAVTSHCKEFP